MAGGAAGVGKLLLKGFIAGGAAVELRFNDTIPDSRPVVCVGEAVDTATRGTEAGGVEGPTRGTSEKPSGAGEVLGWWGSSRESLMGIL